MLLEEGHFRGGDGIGLFERAWLPEGSPKAAVVALHGFTEHGGRYADLAEVLTRHDMAVYAPDLRGHGRSAGPRAWVASFDEYLDDVELYLALVRERQPRRRVYLLGYSMSGLIGALGAGTRAWELDGLILVAAVLQIHAAFFPVLRRLAMLLGHWLPRLRLAKMGAGRLSHDPDHIARFRADPLVFHGRFPTRTGTEILRAVERVEGVMESIRLPLLILQGTGDAVVDPEGSRRLYARAASAEKDLRLYDGLYHDLLGELEKDRIMAEIASWLHGKMAR